MKIIVNQSELMIKLIGEQKIDTTQIYRPFFYVKSLKINDGTLLYNLMTGDVLLLNDEEISAFALEKASFNSIKQELIKRWFIVPLEYNDYKISCQVSDMILSMNRINADIPITNYVILPTTDCNARCFYCYELGGSRKKMTKKTAEDVVGFIVEKSKGKPINIRWFGGEPLYNYEAIDTICNGLKENNIEYSANMISNSYLFEDIMVKKAVELWNIKWVQVTLDGTEEIYNKIKAFIYKEGSAFKKVIKNIDNLLKAGIVVNLRMNMDEYNTEDLKNLSKMLLDKFGDYPNFYMYSNLLFEDSSDKIANRSAEERHKLINAQIELLKFINSNNRRRRIVINQGNRLSHCMADCNRTIMILPDGKLGKCEHYTEDHFVGDIYSGLTDFKMLNWFKTTRPVEERCEKCELRPSCLYPICCMSKPNRCDEFDKKLRTQDLEARMKIMYSEYLKEHNNEIKI